MLSSKDFKEQADEYAKMMKSCFEESQKAWVDGDKAKAKELSIKGNEYKGLLMETNKKYNEILHLEKEQRKNFKFKENVISHVVYEKDIKDKINAFNLYNLEDKNKYRNNTHDEDNFKDKILLENKSALEENIQEEHDFHRLEGSKYAKLMSEAFQEAKLSWEKGEKARAKEFSNLGYEYKEKMEIHNATAVKLIATKNNNEKDSDEIDLHGLYVNEAIQYFKETLELKMRDPNFQSLKVIVGKGLHSKDKPKIKEAIVNFSNQNNLQVFELPDNPGCLIICVGL